MDEMPPLFPKIVRAAPLKFPAPSPSLEKQIGEEQKYLKKLFQDKKPQIQKQIKKAGFSCLMCGRCCERAKGDNSVFILPEEIERINAHLSQNEDLKDITDADFLLPLLPDFYSAEQSMENCAERSAEHFEEQPAKNLEKECFAIHFETFLDILNSLKDQIDQNGRIHTFGRMLRRKENGACFFLDESTKKCRIYDVRPGLCRTYPFYPDGAGILECECDGLESAAETSFSIAAELTGALEKRLLDEQADFKKTQFFLKEMAAQFQMNTDAGAKKAAARLHDGFLTFVIYDGNGVFEVDAALRDI